MKSQNHHAAFYLCASIILLFALAFAATPASAQSGGLNVLSISQIDYSWSGEVQEDAWILFVTQSSQSERIYGIFDKEDIKTIDLITGEEGFATHDIEIAMHPISTSCNYLIEPKTDSINPNIYTASVYTEECGLTLFGTRCNWHGNEISPSEWSDKCHETNGTARKNDRGWLNEKPVLACFYMTDKGTHGELQTPSFNFLTEVVVTKKGIEESRIGTGISNHEKSAYLGSYGYVEWVGSLSSGEYCPMRDELPDAVYTSENGWYLTDNYGYTQYSSYYPLQWNQCLNDFTNIEFQNAAAAKTHAENCVYSLNTAAGNALTLKTITDSKVLNTNVEGNMVKANVKPGAISYPAFKLILPASWLGIYVPKPEPRIVNVKTEWTTATSRGKFRADITNTGEEGGDFTYGLSCQSPAYAMEPERSAYWEKDESKTIDLSLTAAVKKKTTATCTVYVYATKYPDIRDEVTRTITIYPIPSASTPPPDGGETTPTPPPDDEDESDHFFTPVLPYFIIGIIILGAIVGIVFFRRKELKMRKKEGGGKEREKPENSRTDAQEYTKKRGSIRKWIVAVAIIIIVLAAAGVFVVTSFKQPTVGVKTVSVKGFETINLFIVEIPTEAVFSVVLEVRNPNFLGATVSDVEYDLFVNDVYVGKGSLPRPVSIPANGKTNVETEVSVSVSSSIQALVTTIQQGSATAKVNGDVYVKVPILGEVSVPFSEEQKLV